MSYSNRSTRSIRAATAVLALALASVANAGTSGSASLTSDYIFRGVSQTNGDPALQGGIEYAHDSGVYAGVWGSNISWLSDAADGVSSSLELDGYVGYRGKINDAFSYDVGALTYYYPGTYPDGFSRGDTTEIYAGATVTPVENLSLGLKYSYALTELFGFVGSEGSGYLDASANWTFSPGWTLNTHYGKQWIEDNTAYEYADWKVGVTKAFDNGYSIAAAYTGTDADDALYTNPFGNKIADDTVAVTFTKAF